MLAALGQITQHFWQLPDASGVFSAGDKPFEALNKVRALLRTTHHAPHTTHPHAAAPCTSID